MKKKTLTNTFSKHQRESSHWSGSSLLSWWSRMRSQNMSDMASRTFALLLKKYFKEYSNMKDYCERKRFYCHANTSSCLCACGNIRTPAVQV